MRERHQPGRRPRLVGSGVVVGGRARDRAVAGRSQPREGGPDEAARDDGGKLALALYRRDAVRVSLPVVARLDHRLGPVGGHGTAATRPPDGGRIMTPAPIVFLTHDLSKLLSPEVPR